MKFPQKFIVTAKGTVPGAKPYTMIVNVTEHYVIIDGMKLSWNMARAAFEMEQTYAGHRRALFPETS